MAKTTPPAFTLPHWNGRPDQSVTCLHTTSNTLPHSASELGNLFTFSTPLAVMKAIAESGDTSLAKLERSGQTHWRIKWSRRSCVRSRSSALPVVRSMTPICSLRHELNVHNFHSANSQDYPLAGSCVIRQARDFNDHIYASSSNRSLKVWEALTRLPLFSTGTRPVLNLLAAWRRSLLAGCQSGSDSVTLHSSVAITGNHAARQIAVSNNYPS